MDLLTSSNFHWNEKKNKKIEKKSTPVEGCVYYIFLVKSGKISLRIRLVGLGSQIKELKID